MDITNLAQVIPQDERQLAGVLEAIKWIEFSMEQEMNLHNS